MTPRRALALLILVSALMRWIAASSLGLGNDEAYHFLYAIHPDLSYYDHPPMLAWVEMARPGGHRRDLLAGGAAVRVHRPVCRIHLADVADCRPVVWPPGRIPCRPGAQPDGILRAGGIDVRPAGRSLALLLAADDRSAEHCPRASRADLALGLGGSGLGRCDAQQVPCDLPSRGHGAASHPAPAAPALAGPSRPVPGDWPGPLGLQPGDPLECEQRLGFVPVPGGAGRGRARSQARLPGHGACWRKRVTSSPGSGSLSCCS